MLDFGNAVHVPCRREGISKILCYLWSKGFLEAGKERLADNTKRQASSQEVNDLCQENEQAKQATYQSCADNIDKTSRTDYIRSANSLVV
jgi:hypothetical protein